MYISFAILCLCIYLLLHFKLKKKELGSQSHKSARTYPTILHELDGTYSSLTVYPEASLVPRPFLCVRGERGGKDLVNNSTLTRIHGCILAISMDEGKRKCQVGVSRE